jgi:methylmalonyl-CoA mutase, C-terminal domain
MSRVSPRPLRVLMAKPGLDGHNRGVHVIARALRDAGMEVIYLGIRRSPQEIASAAITEDVDVIGLSILSGAHLSLTKALVDCLGAEGVTIPIAVGGIIPDVDVPRLKALGVSAVIGPGARLSEIAEAIAASAGRDVTLRAKLEHKS